MKYKIIQYADMVKFGESVNRNLEDGWILSGGISTVCVDGEIIYIQSMILPPKITNGPPNRPIPAQNVIQ